MVDFFDKISSEVSGILEQSTRNLTGTEKLFSKLEGLGKLGNSSGGFTGNLDYPSGISNSDDLNGHYIQFQIVEANSSRGGGGQSRQVTDVSTPGSVNTITRNRFGLNDITYSIVNTINLYMPEEIRTGYNADWDLGEVGIGSALAFDAFSNLRSDNQKNFVDEFKNLAGGIGDLAASKFNAETLKAGAVDLTQGITQSDSIRNTISAKTKRIKNPHLEFLFKGVGTRQFQFQFRFNPWNDKEAEITRNIIKEFKRHMHPVVEQDQAEGLLGVFLKYPNTFLIKYYSHGNENKWLNKIGRCALINMDVDYAAAGTSSFLREKDGQGSPPADTNITLTFAELDILTRDSMDAGY